MIDTHYSYLAIKQKNNWRRLFQDIFQIEDILESTQIVHAINIFCCDP